MDQRVWFDDDRSDGSAVATVMDDISVSLERSGLIAIDGPAGGGTQLEFDDAVVLVEVLAEAVRIRRSQGYIEREVVLDWLTEHQPR